MNKIIARLIKKANEMEDFIQKCKESNKFSEEQIREIVWGFEDGLTMDQVKIYAKHDFGWKQMEYIRRSFIQGSTIEEVKLFADPYLSVWQMKDIKEFLSDGHSIEETKKEFNL